MSERKTPRALLEEKGPIPADVVAVLISGQIVDLHTPVDADSTMTPVRVNEPKGLDIIRHSSAHVMADAVQRLFPGTKVTIGPSIEDGFFYDFQKAKGTFSDEDLAKIEAAMREVVAGDTPFVREPIDRQAAIDLFTKMGETFKVDIIKGFPEGEEVSLYKHGAPGAEWFDVCKGPHVPRTGMLKAIKLTSVAGAYWRGDERNPMLQRIYGTAFPSEKALAAHLKQIEEAKARDHRKLGKELDLFFFDNIAPAMPFFLPKGAFVYNQLVSYIRGLYDEFGYEEVITPQAFDPKLFLTSGHLPNYAENMYRMWTEDQIEGLENIERNALAGTLGGPSEAPPSRNVPQTDKWYEGLREEAFGLKPMNCPSHCIIFGSRLRSYRELPWRVADFGRLHRYERGGVVHGLSRVRTFCQDDAHIFCDPKDVPKEIESFIKFLYRVYNAFAFTDIAVKLATRPDNRVGTDEYWDIAERALAQGLEAAGLPFEVLPGEGAFYGPKIEFHVKDALKRGWQLGTIQYDPNLPERFDLSFIGEDGKSHRPVMLHRAILGSLERFFSVFVEHCGGNFPTWIAPKQVMLITVMPETFDEYANNVARELRAKGFRVDLDLSNDKLGAKIRNGRLARYPYLAVIGGKEVEGQSLGVRSRDRGELGPIPVTQFIEMLSAEARAPVQ
jgi:threonyl-tRNA synthetase